MSVLSVENLVAGYEKGLPIVRGASLSVASREIVVLLGPNGAGKSTLIKALAGLVPVMGGRVTLDGADITARPAHDMVRLGLAFVPQTENVFAGMSVDENLAIAAETLPRATRPHRRTAVLDLFPDLAEARGRIAGRLSGGQRQMLAIARALVVNPRVLVLDEPTAGLSPRLVALVMDKLRDIRNTGVAILLVEQNVRAGLAVADRALVLVQGAVAHEGTAAAMQNDPVIAALYLGGRRAA